jgi:hypothetical protein
MPNISQFEAIYNVLYITMVYQFVNGLNVELISLVICAHVKSVTAFSIHLCPPEEIHGSLI